MFVFFIITQAAAQNPRTIEARLLKSFKKINYWDQQGLNNSTTVYIDSLLKANNDFGNMLQHYTSAFPATINQEFSLLKNQDLTISNSDDGILRIYSWDTRTGGTMHFFESVFQFKTKGKTVSILDTPKIEGDNRPSYRKIFTLNTLGKAYYLCVYIDIGSSKEMSSGIHFFSIENGRLNAVKLLKTRKGLDDDLSFEFNSSMNTYLQKIRFDRSSNTIFLPLVNERYRMTSKFIEYKFIKGYFRSVKN